MRALDRMTRGDQEESGEDQRPVEVQPDDFAGWMRREERVLDQQRPSRRVVLVPQTDTLQSIQDHRLVQNRFEVLGEMSDTECCRRAPR